MAAVRLLLPPLSRLPHLLIFFFFFLFLSFFPLFISSLSENDALLKFKKSLAHSEALDSWVPGSSPCLGPWNGVICSHGIVTGLRLGSMGLSGKIDVEALMEIHGLRTVSFINNSFSGPLPAFNSLHSLKGIYLSANQFSGEIPSDYFSTMSNVRKLWLSENRFTGRIPESVAKLTHMIELHLEDNQFSGPIPANLPRTLQSLGLSNNKLEGEIPKGLAKFKPEAFKGNEGLCGLPLAKKCEKANVALLPPPPPPSSSSPENERPNTSMSKVITVAGIALIMVAVLVFTSRSSSRHRDEEFSILGKENMDQVLEVQVSGTAATARKGLDSVKRGSGGANRKAAQNARANMNDLMVINDEKGSFGMADLMRAAAEVLGNGGLGSAYKATMATGLSVVVKRMREMNRLGRDSFDAEIRKIGKIRHENILTPLAYHYRKEEKLLISEYVPKGSLLYVMHGDRGISHSELTWPIRLKIIKGVANGMDFLHTEFSSLDVPHGNLKSSNILLESDYTPLLTDYAFQPLVNMAQASQTMFSYRAPGILQEQPVSPKCDVYCLGIVILEILTGKFPTQYLSNGKGGTDVVQWVKSVMEENRETELIDPEIASEASENEMRRLLYIAAECVESDPQKRLDMKEAFRRIQEIKE